MKEERMVVLDFIKDGSSYKDKQIKRLQLKLKNVVLEVIQEKRLLKKIPKLTEFIKAIKMRTGKKRRRFIDSVIDRIKSMNL